MLTKIRIIDDIDDKTDKEDKLRISVEVFKEVDEHLKTNIGDLDPKAYVTVDNI